MRFPHVGIPGEARALRPWRIRPTPRRYCRPTAGNTRLGPALSALADTRRFFFFISIRHPRFTYLFYSIHQYHIYFTLYTNVTSILFYTLMLYLLYINIISILCQHCIYSIIHINIISIPYINIISIMTSRSSLIFVQTEFPDDC